MPSYRVVSSPKYLEIKALFEEHRSSLENESMTRYRFMKEFALPLDPNLNEGSFMTWLGSQLKGTKEKVAVLVEKHFLKDYEKKTNEERMADVDKMQTEIRYFAKKLFHNKIYEFIENPELANKLTLLQLQKLYKMIREEESRETELGLKKQDSKRKDIFGLFAIMSLAKTFTPDELEKVEQLVKKRRDGEHQLQQSGGASDTGSAEGATTDVPGPVESSSVGQV